MALNSDSEAGGGLRVAVSVQGRRGRAEIFEKKQCEQRSVCNFFYQIMKNL